ncbi:M15 family metallopeptidase [Streptomyces sp. NBC_00893]|uniref:M15 family metallopeptidase n=1 Tax=Streptomyces sp. NBC_00893 TaxID=2975862 RepID=UPI00224D0747|nr:M15 family metallopeptidase [Streptomyces sp. NBC_00893]MCX4844155.1 M15 family metallopeptidase [Streptomyces sp. NBC_00893]
MHDNPAKSRSVTAARRLSGRTVAGVGVVLVVAVTAAWGLTTRSEPAAHADATADRAPGGGTTTAEVTPEVTPEGADKAADKAADEAADEGGTSDGRQLTPFDTRYPAIARLDERLLKAVQQAARDARDDGIEFRVTSGWRSKAHQQRLLDEGIEKYGSAEKARQFVNTPQKSTHVSGKAVDIGPTDADDWLIRNGSDYGLCQVYNNEMWHFELLTRPGGTCPAPLSNAAG